MKRFAAFFLALTMLLVAGCGSSKPAGSPAKTDGETSKAGDKKELKVGVSLMTLQYPFFKDIAKGIEDAAAKQGVSVTVKDSGLNLQTQISAIENFVAQGVDAIILNAVDPKGVSTALETAAKANIPVITVDMKPEGSNYLTFIGSDNRLGGQLAGKYAADYIKQKLGGKAKVAILTNALSSSAQERVGGFKDEMAKLSGVTVVAEKAADTREKFLAAVENILVANPDVNVIFGYSAQAGLGANDAVVAAKKEKSVMIIGFDAADDEQTEIKKGLAYAASVIQFPDKLGQISLETALKAIKKEKVEATIPVEVGLYTKDKILSAKDLGQ